MKASFLFLVAFFTLSVGTFAQNKSNGTPATLFAREAASQLKLSEMEYIKIRNLIQSKFDEIDEAMKVYQDDQPMLKEAVAQIEKQYDEQIIAVLPAKSQTAYLPLKSSIELSAMTAANRP